MSLYLWINILSIFIPIVVSFHPRSRLYLKWPVLLVSIPLSMFPYILWDIYFTEHGFWGFNPLYLQGIYLFALPLEEWLFFISIPYACIFTHYSMVELFPHWKLSSSQSRRMTLVFFILSLVMIGLGYSRAYTLMDGIFLLGILPLAYLFKPLLLQRFWISFFIILFPFFIVNGILTGTGIDQEVVWYNDAENMGVRLGTIPVEDTLYAFTLLLLNLLVFEFLDERWTKRPLSAIRWKK